MKEEFIKNKIKLINLDNSIIDIELMGVFGNRWGSHPKDEEMMLRLIYKGEKRLIKTVKGDDWYDDLTMTIYKIRKYYREHKLERLLDGVI